METDSTIFLSPEFAPYHNWLQDLNLVGNTLKFAELKWSLAVGPQKNKPLMALAAVGIQVKEENRDKSNEVVFFRPDLQAVLAYEPTKDVWKTRIVVVREFRAACRAAYVWELPAGSSFVETDPLKVAQKELKEETGLVVDASRFCKVGTRQMLATLCSHKAGLFALELTTDEMDKLALDSQPKGNVSETERTYVHVMQLQEIVAHSGFDWSVMGLIFGFFGPLLQSQTKAE
jgi:8-oxo-dGTP pyrophosphatase MutT (NUDIX family)